MQSAMTGLEIDLGVIVVTGERIDGTVWRNRQQRRNTCALRGRTTATDAARARIADTGSPRKSGSARNAKARCTTSFSS